nr:MAG TPA: hypothetical protein [Caudoviricetes sp.]
MCGSKLFGGGSSHVSAPKVEQVAPAPTQVTNADTNATEGTAEAERKNRRKRGYASTQLAKNSNDTVLGNANSGGRTTLG